jgi:hypothetical protein
MQQINSTIEILMARFHGQVLIPFVSASESAGIPEQTARNRLAKGNYPIPTVLNGSRRFIHISDLAEYIESLRSPKPQPQRGRPRKTASASR